jgi:SAM-dependent methyltransferase
VTTRHDTKQAEKDYLARSGSREWEIAKPFSPPGQEMFGHGAEVLHDFAVAMLTLRPEPHDLILDLGAGAGWCSDLLGRLNRSAIALDISFDLLRTSRARPGPPIRAVAGDMESLPFRSGAFSKAICLSAIHHVPDIHAAVREIARVLSPGGKVLFSEPGRGHAHADVSTRATREYGVLEQDVIVEDFMLACQEAGFRDVRVQPLAYTIPGYSLTLDAWRSWSRLAGTNRPQRALRKIALACAEIVGAGKRGALFEDTFAITLVRTLRPVMERHPIIVAAK